MYIIEFYHVKMSRDYNVLSFFIIVYLGEASDEDDNDQDTLKETLLETNPYLLGLTIIVSILHSVFEFLAFKNGKQLKEKIILPFTSITNNQNTFTITAI